MAAADCPIEHVITVQALREGWDCANAYILCAIANVHSAQNIEQLLGRIMRMPQAKRRAHPDLNRAYAHVPKDNVHQAIAAMRDKLAVKLGFEEQEVNYSVQAALSGVTDYLSLPPAAEFFTEKKPDFAALSEENQVHISEFVEVIPLSSSPQEESFPEQESPKYRVVVKDFISSAAQKAIIAVVSPQNRIREESRLQQQCQYFATQKSPARRGVRFAPLPQLVFYSPQEECEVVADESTLYEIAEWNLLGDDILLEDFRINETGEKYIIDLHGDQVICEKSDNFELPLSDNADDDRAKYDRLAGWLENEIRDPLGRYFPDTLRRFVGENMENLLKKYKLAQLDGVKYQLAAALKAWLRRHEERTEKQIAQEFLFDNAALKCRFSFEFAKNGYIFGDNSYSMHYRFKKHYYGVIGDMDNNEETECAWLLDGMSAVKHWVRNLPRKPNSFSLPLGGRRNFYPDFIAELNNDKVLIVEYKGADRYDNPEDGVIKRNIGKKLESLSDGKCFFMMASIRPNAPPLKQQITDKIAEICANN